MTVQTCEISKTDATESGAQKGLGCLGPDTIVCVSGLFWDEHWCSEQQLMSRLAMRGRVLYIERPVSPFSFFTKSGDAPIGRQFWRWLAGGIRNEGSNLTILTPPPALPLRYFAATNAINEWILLCSIKRALKRFGAKRSVLWIYSPEAGRIVGKVGEVLSLYYCADDWEAWGQWWNRAQDIRAREEQLAAKVDLIVGTSTKIVKRWSQSHREVMLILNGADVRSFRQALDPKLNIANDLRSIPEPRVGFIGYIDGRFDVNLYEMLAASRPDWSFVIVGPLVEREVNVSRLRQMHNVYFFPKCAPAQMPAYLKGFNVCTIPYICNKLSESIFPLKLFEYLAAGRQVVSTALPELRPFSQYIRIADSPEGFLRAIELSMTDPRQQASDEFLDANSWDAKADFLWKKLVFEVTHRSQST